MHITHGFADGPVQSEVKPFRRLEADDAAEQRADNDEETGAEHQAKRQLPVSQVSFGIRNDLKWDRRYLLSVV